jgi:tetratricopeptide (TPR) repeat protein
MNKYLLIPLLILLVNCDNPSNRSLSHYIAAKNYLSTKEISKAEFEINKAISIDSTNKNFAMLKSEIYISADNFDQAIALLMELNKSEFKPDSVNYLLCHCYFKKASYHHSNNLNEMQVTKDYNEGITYCDTAIDNNSSYYEAYVTKYMALHNLEKPKEAISTINTALQLFKDSISLITYKGIEKISLGDLQGATEDLNKVINNSDAKSNNLVKAYRFKALILRSQNKLHDAIDLLTKALELDSENSMLLSNRGDCYRLLGKMEEACMDYRQAADLGFIRIYDRIEEYCN